MEREKYRLENNLPHIILLRIQKILHQAFERQIIRK